MVVRIAQLVVALLVVAGTVHAQSFANRLSEAYDALGVASTESATLDDAEHALKLFKDLKVEQPEDPAVNYGLTTARYLRGVSWYEGGQREMARQEMNVARNAYTNLAIEADPELARHAQLGAANSTAQIAKDAAHEFLQKEILVTPEEHETALTETAQAVNDYQTYLQTYPNDTRARQYLSKARYLHKRVQQNPPPEDEQPQNEDSEDGESDEGDQQGEDGESGEDQNSEENQDGDENSGEDEQEADGEEGDTDQTGTGNETQADMTQNDLSRQNIEAILQSLEETNRQAQEELLQQGEPTKIRNGQWW